MEKFAPFCVSYRSVTFLFMFFLFQSTAQPRLLLMGRLPGLRMSRQLKVPVILTVKRVISMNSNHLQPKLFSVDGIQFPLIWVATWNLHSKHMIISFGNQI